MKAEPQNIEQANFEGRKKPEGEILCRSLFIQKFLSRNRANST